MWQTTDLLWIFVLIIYLYHLYHLYHLYSFPTYVSAKVLRVDQVGANGHDADTSALSRSQLQAQRLLKLPIAQTRAILIRMMFARMSNKCQIIV
jgi:hypothetical protein